MRSVPSMFCKTSMFMCVCCMLYDLGQVTRRCFGETIGEIRLLHLTQAMLFSDLYADLKELWGPKIVQLRIHT